MSLLLRPTQAATIDQFVEDFDFVTTTNGVHGQEFTVGETGTLVTIEAALRGERGGQYTPALRTVELQLVRQRNGVPSLLPEDLLASSSTSFSAGTFAPVPDEGYNLRFQWVQFDLPPIAVTEGDQLAFLFPSSDVSETQWATRSGNKYERGDYFSEYGSIPLEIDGLFRTYVIPVPETRSLTTAFLAMILLHTVGYRAIRPIQSHTY